MGMKDPAKSLGEGITGVNDPADVMKNDITITFPILNLKIVNVNVTGALSR
jgi:hypothetical protein